MDPRPRFTAAAREDARRRLRRLTGAGTLLSAGAVAALAGVSWATLPGTSASTGSGGTTAATTTTSNDTVSSPSNASPATSTVQPAATAPTASTTTTATHAVTGGSHHG